MTKEKRTRATELLGMLTRKVLVVDVEVEVPRGCNKIDRGKLNS